MVASHVFAEVGLQSLAGRGDVANWTSKFAAAFHSISRGFGRSKKVKSTSFDDTNRKLPFNASGVAEVGPGRFVFIDNHDPSAVFELALDAAHGAAKGRHTAEILAHLVIVAPATLRIIVLATSSPPRPSVLTTRTTSRCRR